MCVGLSMWDNDRLQSTSIHIKDKYHPHLLYNEVVVGGKGGGGILVSPRPSVRLSVRPFRSPCPLCSAYSCGWIHFKFIHHIKQEVCRVWSFFKFLTFLLNLKLWLCLFLTWDLMWITGIGNHGAAAGISERRRSSCSSYVMALQGLTMPLI